ncbi:MAG TPA: DUF4290 domain-containing protein [Bacteroidetes bacterium]|nr:DUF4290 domain-containing protein [Bacteroidota bacterium]
MKYKITNEILKLREYGRNVQEMVKYAKTLEDPIERNVLSREIVRIMSNMNPQLRDGPDYQQKLWDHFFYLAEYEIEVDTDFPMPEPELLFSKAPERMPYNTKRSRFRQYGQNVELMAEQAIGMEEGEERSALIFLTLNIMKMQLKGREKDSNAEATVCEHLKIMTKGKLAFTPDQILFNKYANIPPSSQPSNLVQNIVYPKKQRGGSKNQSKGKYNKGGGKGGGKSSGKGGGKGGGRNYKGRR